ncbi:MAG: hypothetical protein IT328_20030 [Caldilineaceae bacterium]|nr:hypothetical protein [Caldilineaceae bacterium]
MTEQEFIRRAKIGRRYGVGKGRRFADVAIRDKEGRLVWSCSVVTREGSGHSEITAAGEIKQLAWTRYQVHVWANGGKELIP